MEKNSKNNILRHQLLDTMTDSLSHYLEDRKLADQEALWILEFITGKSHAELLTSTNIELSEAQQDKIVEIIRKRVQEHEPLQYLLGTAPFLGLHFIIRPPVLIPRPETEEICNWLIKRIEQLPDAKKTAFSILDIGTGSGCIALSLAYNLPYATILGVDIEDEAIALSKENAQHLGLSHARFIKSDLYEGIQNRKHCFDIIISNPPYISPEEYTDLDESVRNWEDRRALVAEDQGLAIIQRIIAGAQEFLVRDGLFGPRCRS